MTPTRAHEFFATHVASSIKDWRGGETELHRAMAVATNLAHMADYFWESFSELAPERVFGTKSVKAFRVELARMHVEFGLIRDICDAHKHLRIDRPDRHVTSAGQSTVTQLGRGEAKWGEGQWNSPPEGSFKTIPELSTTSVRSCAKQRKCGNVCSVFPADA